MNNTIAVIALVLIAAAPVQAQLGKQAFGDVHYNDTNVSQMEIAMAETSFSNPGIMPDSPLYFLKRISESLKMMFTFGTNEQARLHIEFAKNRLAETKRLIEEKKTQIAERTANEFSKEVDMIDSSPRGIGDNVSAIRNNTEILRKSSIVLGLVLEKAPDAARSALERALNKSLAKEAELLAKIQFRNEADADEEDEVQKGPGENKGPDEVTEGTSITGNAVSGSKETGKSLPEQERREETEPEDQQNEESQSGGEQAGTGDSD